MRNLNPDLKAFIDSKTDIDPRAGFSAMMLAAATTLLGITVNDQDRINQIRSTIVKPWDEAWCVDFVQTCVAYAEARKGVLSPLPATEGVLDLWDRARPDLRTVSPQAGDVILWRLGATGSGHCGIITGSDSLSYATIEGNTSASVGIVRDGNGVYAKKRAKGGTKTFAEVGFLKVLA